MSSKKISLKDKFITADAVEDAYKRLSSSTPTAPSPVISQPIQPVLPQKERPAALPRAVSRPAARTVREVEEPVSAAAERNIRITVDVPENLHGRLKMYTVMRRQSIRDFILALVEREMGAK